jgi:hypothetical protein
MTRSREKGENPIVVQAKKEAARTGRTPGEILKEMLAAAKRVKDTARRMEIQRAQKFM